MLRRIHPEIHARVAAGIADSIVNVALNNVRALMTPFLARVCTALCLRSRLEDTLAFRSRCEVVCSSF